MNSEIWVVTSHYGKGNENVIKSFSEYCTAIKYLGNINRNNPSAVSLRKVEFVDEGDYQSTLGDGV